MARQAPHLTAAVSALAPTIYQAAMGISGVTLPPDPIQSIPTYAGALAAFQRLPPIRVMFDNGAGSATPGAPYPGFARSFSRFPIPGTQARSWYLADAGTLSREPATAGAADRFTGTSGPGRRPASPGDTGGGPGGLWTATPAYHWDQNPPGTRGRVRDRAAAAPTPWSSAPGRCSCGSRPRLRASTSR